MNPISLLAAGLSQGSLYALVALGLVLIYKTQQNVNWAHGEILMIGAFSAYVGHVLVGLPYAIAFLLAVAGGGLLGVVMERLAFRRLVNQHHAASAMAAIGLGVLFKGIARIPFGGDVYTLPPAIQASAPVVVGGAVIAPQSLLTIAVACALTGMLLLFFRLSKLGKQMRATQQNLLGARIVGIDTGRVFSVTWMLAAGIGAATGVLAAPTALLFPDMGGPFLLKGFAAAVLGGFNSIAGAIVGGVAVGVIETFVGGYMSTAFQDVSPFLIILIVLFVRPNGLFGQASVKRV